MFSSRNNPSRIHEAGGMAAPRCTRAIFVGNSLTYYNNGVDKHFSFLRNASVCESHDTGTDRSGRVDESAPRSVVAERFAVGGASLEVLWKTTSAVDSIHSFCNPARFSSEQTTPIESETNDMKSAVVVLQEDLPETSVYSFHKHLAYFVRETRSAGGVPVLYMCWPYDRLKWCSWDVLIAEHKKAAQSLGIKLAPVGMALQTALKERPELDLFAPDSEHPSPLGTFLAAAIIYCTVYGEPPHVIPNPVGCEHCSSSDIEYVTSLAWSTSAAVLGIV